ncbi:hypothetical protein [Nostoc sp.]|uniref:hypothetical protein n=1 Tax=Nostoc sp. TaxID=1180 RepID=UPI002FF4E878
MQTLVSAPSGLEINACEQFGSWLCKQNLSLAFTTYQTNAPTPDTLLTGVGEVRQTSKLINRIFESREN